MPANKQCTHHNQQSSLFQLYTSTRLAQQQPQQCCVNLWEQSARDSLVPSGEPKGLDWNCRISAIFRRSASTCNQRLHAFNYYYYYGSYLPAADCTCCTLRLVCTLGTVMFCSGTVIQHWSMFSINRLHIFESVHISVCVTVLFMCASQSPARSVWPASRSDGLWRLHKGRRKVGGNGTHHHHVLHNANSTHTQRQCTTPHPRKHILAHGTLLALFVLLSNRGTGLKLHEMDAGVHILHIDSPPPPTPAGRKRVDLFTECRPGASVCGVYFFGGTVHLKTEQESPEISLMMRVAKCFLFIPPANNTRRPSTATAPLRTDESCV